MSTLFNPSGLTPHGFCLLWQPGLIWLHALSDLLTGLAYFSIPAALVVFARRRRDLAFGGMFWLFAAFILACGATHFLAIVTLWVPLYLLEGLVKAITAALSVTTAILLWPLLPQAAALPSPSALQDTIDKLEAAESKTNEANRWLVLGEQMARVGHWHVSLPDYKVAWSDEIFRIYGLSRHDFVPTLDNALEAYLPADQEVVRRDVENAIAKRGSFEHSVSLRRPSGEIRHILSRGLVQIGPDGKPASVFGVAVDRTDERRKDEERQKHETDLALALTAVATSEMRYRLLADNATDLIFELSLDFRCRYVSSSAIDILGRPPADIAAMRLMDLVHPDDRGQVREAYRAVAGGLDRTELVHRDLRPNGDIVWLHVALRLIRSPEGAPQSIVGIARDISARKAADDAIRESEARYRLLADNLKDLVTCVGPDGRRTYASPSSVSVLGYAPEDLLGADQRNLIHPEDRDRVDAMIAALRDGAPQGPVEYRALHKNGTYVWVETDAKLMNDGVSIASHIRDISERKRAEQQILAANAKLEEMAMIDGLTGLPNRRRLDEALTMEFKRAIRMHTSLALILIDVDHFKGYNDAYGHPAGDSCLRAIADVLPNVLRQSGDLVARYGGEEMAVLLPNTSLAGAMAIAERLIQLVRDIAIEHSGNGGIVTISAGVAAFVPAEDRHTPLHLVPRADMALYEAKHTGRNRACAFVPGSADGNAAGAPDPGLLVPAQQDEERRLAALAVYAAAGAARPSAELDRIARLAASLLSAPIALVTLVGRDELTLAGRFGVDLDRKPRGVSFCANTVGRDAVFVILDALQDERFAHHPLVVGEPRIRFYAGAPLISAIEGQRIGALCILDRLPHAPLSAGQKALLTDMAALAVSHLDQIRMEAGIQARPEESP